MACGFCQHALMRTEPLPGSYTSHLSTALVFSGATMGLVATTCKDSARSVDIVVRQLHIYSKCQCAGFDMECTEVPAHIWLCLATCFHDRYTCIERCACIWPSAHTQIRLYRQILGWLNLSLIFSWKVLSLLLLYKIEHFRQQPYLSICWCRHMIRQ